MPSFEWVNGFLFEGYVNTFTQGCWVIIQRYCRLVSAVMLLFISVNIQSRIYFFTWIPAVDSPTCDSCYTTVCGLMYNNHQFPSCKKHCRHLRVIQRGTNTSWQLNYNVTCKYLENLKQNKQNLNWTHF